MVIDRKFLVNAQVWKLIDGEPQELKVDDNVFVLKPTPTSTPTLVTKSKKHIKHNVKMSYLEKWIRQGDFEVFTLEQFFKAFPKQKRNDNLNRNVSGLVDKKMITPFNDITNSCLLPLSGKKRFKVNRKVVKNELE